MSRKLALIIGNNNYMNKPLTNCVNDATCLAKVLRPVENCQVELQTNLKSEEIYECIKNFTASIKQNDFVIFFFAGHGRQWGDQNFLLPCDDNKITDGDDMQRYGINAQSTVDKMSNKQPHVVLFLLDCCRSYWMPSKTSNDRGSDQKVGGLNKMTAPRQTLIAFACAAGEVVSDQSATSNNGLFTTYLLKRITTPGEHIETVLRKVANDVATATDHSQIPFRVSSIIAEEVYLVPNVHFHPQASGQSYVLGKQSDNKNQHVIQQKNDSNSSVRSTSSERKSRETMGYNLPPGNRDLHKKLELSVHMVAPSAPQAYPYHSITFGLNSSSHPKVQELFERLKSLPPMDKYRSMSGDCDFETTQMEQFLSQTFDFKNPPGEYIVQGVRAFRLDKPVESLPSNLLIRFPSKSTTSNSFKMSVEEIRTWQRSYVVYADKKMTGMSKAFLLRALQGQSGHGEEAFRMKFVVRISQCPILMEFDGYVISRSLIERWPHNIKLVSVTGVDFAGRIHDVDDITTYVLNWQDVYEIDRRSGLPIVYNGRDFRRRINGPPGRLDEKRLFEDLKRMARLRLRACDREEVQIVVETGIGLGVFAGEYIGIDETVRTLSASAIRAVLEEDGPSYQTILGVVFALPIFSTDARKKDTYYTFANVFGKNEYKGRIPVFIADQDMHRLTVAIARDGFLVSELNPADSHGVFGEYWQNREPDLEEKLALTTVGLLVQHHMINPYVLDPNHYHLI